MNFSFKHTTFATLHIVLVALLATGCGSEGGERSASTPDSATPSGTGTDTPVDRVYAGPGSRWDVRLNADASFSIERRATLDSPVVLTVTGTWQTLDNGLTQLFVNNAQGEDAPAPGDTAWAIEVPGFAIFLKPDESPFGGFIAMIDAGTCPTEAMLTNWVTVKPAADADASASDQAHFGAFAFDPASGDASLTARYALDGTALEPVSLGGATCADGVLETSHAQIYLAASGGGLVRIMHPDENQRAIVFAMTQASLDTIDTLDHEYVGLLYDPGNPGGNNVSPALLQCTAGLCSGQVFSSLNTSDAFAEFTLDLFGTLDHPEAGLLTGEMRMGAAAGELVCQTRTGLGEAAHTLLSCVGQNPAAPTQQINLIARTQ